MLIRTYRNILQLNLKHKGLHDSYKLIKEYQVLNPRGSRKQYNFNSIYSNLILQSSICYATYVFDVLIIMEKDVDSKKLFQKKMYITNKQRSQTRN